MNTTDAVIAMLQTVLQEQTKTICSALVELERVRINGAAIMGYTEASRAESQDAASIVVNAVSASVDRANNALEEEL